MTTMTVLLIAIIAVSTISMVFNITYIVHELGWFPHTKDRKSPHEKTFPHRSLMDTGRKKTHDFQVMHELNYELRKLGHPDVYNFKSPHTALENVMQRYQEQPTRSRYDDLVHLSNYISNHVTSDERINALIDKIAAMTQQSPAKN